MSEIDMNFGNELMNFGFWISEPLPKLFFSEVYLNRNQSTHGKKTRPISI